MQHEHHNTESISEAEANELESGRGIDRAGRRVSPFFLHQVRKKQEVVVRHVSFLCKCFTSSANPE